MTDSTHRSKIVVFLDRDGTINRNFDDGPVYETERFELLPGAANAVRLLNKLNLKTFVATNQGGINHPDRNFSWDTYYKIEELMHQRLEEEAGAYVDSVYLCEHADFEACGCRKPGIGMFEQAAEEHSFDPSLSYMVGDSDVDILAGKYFGLHSILVTSGWKEGVAEKLEEAGRPADFIAEDLSQAVAYIQNRVT